MREALHLVYRRPDQMRVGDEFALAGWNKLSSVTNNMSEVMDRLDAFREDSPEHAIPLPEEAFDGDEMVAYLISHDADHGGPSHEHLALLMPGQVILCRAPSSDDRSIATASYRPEEIVIGDQVIIGGLVQDVFHVGTDLDTISIGLKKVAQRYGIAFEDNFDELREAVSSGEFSLPLHLFVHSDRIGPSIIPVDSSTPLIEVIA